MIKHSKITPLSKWLSFPFIYFFETRTRGQSVQSSPAWAGQAIVFHTHEVLAYLCFLSFLCVHLVLVMFVCCNMDTEVRVWLTSVALSFHHMDSRDWTQVIRHGGKNPCPQNDLSGHWHFYHGKSKPTTQSDWQFQTYFTQLADKHSSDYRKIFLNDSKLAPQPRRMAGVASPQYTIFRNWH